MKDSNLRNAPEAANSAEAFRLLRALSVMEKHGESVTENLVPFDKAGSRLTEKDLSMLRESLKRIANRVGVCTAVAERMEATPEKDPDPPAAEASAPRVVTTLEDEMFPLDGFSDNVTGLPARPIAEKAIDSAMGVGRPRYAVVFVLDRIGHMSNRYSIEVGTQAIRQCTQFLNQKLPADSLLFRWRGAAVVSVFDCSGMASDVRLLMEQIAIEKQKFNFINNGRSAMVNLTVSFLTIPFADHPTAESVYQLIDRFVESHSARQPR